MYAPGDGAGPLIAIEARSTQNFIHKSTSSLHRVTHFPLSQVKHEVTKNSMHRETERVLDRELAAKQEVLDQAHSTLAALHQRFTALTQVRLVASTRVWEDQIRHRPS